MCWLLAPAILTDSSKGLRLLLNSQFTEGKKMPRKTGKRTVKKLEEELASELSVETSKLYDALQPTIEALEGLLGATPMITPHSNSQWSVCWLGGVARWDRAAVPAGIIAKGADAIHEYLGRPCKA